MTRSSVKVLAIGIALAMSSAVWAVDPNQLPSAYWRFEEGTANGRVEPRNEDVVLDSINDNDLRAFMNVDVDAAPTYVNTVPPTPLQSGLPNTLALDFIPNQDLFAEQQDINNGTISPGGGFTVEAAFMTNNPARYAGIVGKEGRPGLGKLGGNFIENLQTFVLKTRQDNSLLQVEQWDGGEVMFGEEPVQISSLAPLVAGQWYYAAVVNDGSTLALWLDSNDGAGYQLQGTTTLNGGALYQGDDPANPDWDRPWTIGRGEFGGGPADFFDGIIDEVRLSNRPLMPSEFLFAPASTPVLGDYNDNGTVDAADYVVWRDQLGQSATIPNDETPGMVTEGDYDVWRRNFGLSSGGGAAAAVVPEPAGLRLFMLGMVVGGLSVRCRWRGQPM
jgi:hypothetical protein